MRAKRQQKSKQRWLRFGSTALATSAVLGGAGLTASQVHADTQTTGAHSGTQSTANSTASNIANRSAGSNGLQTRSQSASSSDAQAKTPSDVDPQCGPLAGHPSAQIIASTYGYKIQAGDTLNSIAVGHHVSTASIVADNPGVDFAHLVAGTQLRIPHAANASHRMGFTFLKNGKLVVDPNSDRPPVHTQLQFGKLGAVNGAQKSVPLTAASIPTVNRQVNTAASNTKARVQAPVGEQSAPTISKQDVDRQLHTTPNSGMRQSGDAYVHFTAPASTGQSASPEPAVQPAKSASSSASVKPASQSPASAQSQSAESEKVQPTMQQGNARRASSASRNLDRTSEPVQSLQSSSASASTVGQQTNAKYRQAAASNGVTNYHVGPVVREQPVTQTVHYTKAPAQTGYVSPVTGRALAAKNWIAYQESRGEYGVRNGNMIGRYQLTSSYLHGDYSRENQERTADRYASQRYGGWINAKRFWQAHHWY